MEKWNYYQPCDSIISQLSVFSGVRGGGHTVNEKIQATVVAAEDKPRQNLCRMTGEHTLSSQTEKAPETQVFRTWRNFVVCAGDVICSSSGNQGSSPNMKKKFSVTIFETLHLKKSYQGNGPHNSG